MAIENEPVYTSSVVSGVATGTGFFILQEPFTVILLEIGASERLSKAIVNIIMFIMPVVISLAGAWWARRRVVPLAVANDRIQQAFELHPNSPQQSATDLMVTKGG